MQIDIAEIPTDCTEDDKAQNAACVNPFLTQRFHRNFKPQAPKKI